MLRGLHARLCHAFLVSDCHFGPWALSIGLADFLICSFYKHFRPHRPHVMHRCGLLGYYTDVTRNERDL